MLSWQRPCCVHSAPSLMPLPSGACVDSDPKTPRHPQGTEVAGKVRHLRLDGSADGAKWRVQSLKRIGQRRLKNIDLCCRRAWGFSGSWPCRVVGCGCLS